MEKEVEAKFDGGSDTSKERVIVRDMAAKILAEKTKDETPVKEEDETSVEESEDISEEEEESEEESEGEESNDSEGEDEEKEEEENPEEDDEEEESEEEEEDAEEGEDEQPKPKKAIQVITNGKKSELPANAKIMVPIDGKMVEVDAHKVISEFSGRYVVDREMTRAKRIQKESQESFDKNVDAAKQFKEIDRKLSRAFKASLDEKENDPFAVHHAVAEIMGIDPVQYEREALRKAVALVVEMHEKGYLENEQSQNSYLELREARYYKNKKAREEAEKEENQKRGPLEQRISELKKNAAITDSEWQEAEDVLAAEKRAGRLQKVEPADTAEMVSYLRSSRRAKELVEEQAPGLRRQYGDSKFFEVQKVVQKAIREYDLRGDELEELVKEAVSDFLEEDDDLRDAKHLGKKVSKSQANGEDKPKKKQVKIVRTFGEMRASFANRGK